MVRTGRNDARIDLSHDTISNELVEFIRRFDVMDFSLANCTAYVFPIFSQFVVFVFRISVISTICKCVYLSPYFHIYR